MKDDLILENTEVRPTVYWYAKRMEKRLREKDKKHKGNNWLDGNFYYYLTKAATCMKNILGIISITQFAGCILHERNSNIKEKDIYFAIKKCIDGGNFFMMLADNLRDELLKRGMNK